MTELLDELELCWGEMLNAVSEQSATTWQLRADRLVRKLAVAAGGPRCIENIRDELDRVGIELTRVQTLGTANRYDAQLRRLRLELELAQVARKRRSPPT